MLTAAAPAKLNLALVVGGLRDDGRHEVVTVVEKLALHDTITVVSAAETLVEGFPDDTLVRDALRSVAERAGGEPAFRATIEKRIPVAAGLGGGSADAALALRLANELLPDPLPDGELHRLAAALGADVPLFLRDGPVLATGDGTLVEDTALPGGYHVLLWIPAGHAKSSTAAVYAGFDARRGHEGFARRRRALLGALAGVRDAADLAALPVNDLVTASEAELLLEHGAFRADVTGAGPTLYGLFHDADEAASAARAFEGRGRVWLTRPERASAA